MTNLYGEFESSGRELYESLEDAAIAHQKHSDELDLKKVGGGGDEPKMSKMEEFKFTDLDAGRKPDDPGQDPKRKAMFVVVVVVSVIVVVLFLGVVALCVAYSITTTDLQSDVADLQSDVADLQLDVADLLDRLEVLKRNITALGQNLTSCPAPQDPEASLISQRIDSLNSSFEMLLSDHDQVLSLFANLNESVEELRADFFKLVPNIPIFSCTDLPLSSPSGYYIIHNPEVPMAMCSLSCGGVSGHWVPVADLDMTRRFDVCPAGFDEVMAGDNDQRVCVISSEEGACQEVEYPVDFRRYSKVCGKIIGYQFGSTDAFHAPADTLSDLYVDGVILMHGEDPGQHIWTFANDFGETPSFPGNKCPCNDAHRPPGFISPPTPSFVGDDYFCDTGNRGDNEAFNNRLFFGSDPLWDGAGCGLNNTCCAFNSPPWFVRELPQATRDDIVMRVCRDSPRINEDIGIEMIELFIMIDEIDFVLPEK